MLKPVFISLSNDIRKQSRFYLNYSKLLNFENSTFTVSLHQINIIKEIGYESIFKAHLTGLENIINNLFYEKKMKSHKLIWSSCVSIFNLERIYAFKIEKISSISFYL